MTALYPESIASSKQSLKMILIFKKTDYISRLFNYFVSLIFP